MRLGKSAIVLLVGLVLASGAGMVATISRPTAAYGISEGAGMSTMGGFIGGFQHSNGQIVFCVEMGRPPQKGIHPALGATSALPAYTATYFHSGVGSWANIHAPVLSGEGLKTLNKVLSKYGQTADSSQAAAVQIAVWEIRADGANDSYHRMLAAMKSTLDPSVVSYAGEMIREAQASDAAENAPGDPRIHHTGAYTGYVIVDPGTTELSISNGVFDATGNSAISFPGGTREVQTVAWTGQAPYDGKSWARYYRVEVNGKYVYQSSPAEVAFGHPGGFGQGIASGTGSTPVTGDYRAVYVDPDTLWSPVLSTETPSKFVKRDESFGDLITFGIAAGSNPWRTSVTTAGESRFAPIVAKGKLYGPFLQDPALNPSATPPRGAPVAATASVSTDSVKGPGTYEVTRIGKSEESGYYSWVWHIEGGDQATSVISPPNGLEGALPPNYFFTDGFGQATEGQLTPTELRWSTEMSEAQVPIGGTFTDGVHVSLQNGGWLQNAEGKRTPFTLRGTVYLVEKKPVRQPIAPEGAEVLTTTKMTVDNVAQYTSQEMSIPLTTTANYATIQWCLFNEDQTAEAEGKAEEWCDDYGVPSETLEILRPHVETKAIERGEVAGTIHDLASVTGGLPKNAKTEIEFELFLKPEPGKPKYNQEWELIADEEGKAVLWTEAELADPAASVKAQPVAKTARVQVTELGEVRSPDVFARSAGTTYWVERTIITPNNASSAAAFEYSKGRYGLANETTLIDEPKVRTEGKTVTVGEDIWDTAFTRDHGDLSALKDVEYKITFKAYAREQGKEMVCSTDNEIKDFADATGVVVSKPGQYESKKVKTAERHVGLGGYQETLVRVERGHQVVVAVGKCGEISENLEVRERPNVPADLVETGGSLALLWIFTGGGVLMLGGVILLAVKRRARETAPSGDRKSSGNAGA